MRLLFRRCGRVLFVTSLMLVTGAAVGVPETAPVPTSALSARPATVVGPGSVRVLPVSSVDHDMAVRDVWVYRPGVPDSASLPVVYFLHGVPGTASDLFDAGAARALDRLFMSGVAPFVVASPTGFGNAHPDTEWADSLDGADRIETYVLRNVIPAVEGRFRRDRAHRVIAGFSMGGYGAANIGLRHPETFGAIASFAGYFKIDDPSWVFGRKPKVEAANNPSLLVAKVHDVRVFLAVGTDDAEPVVRGEAERFGTRAGVRPLVAIGNHSFAFVIAHLGDLAAFVAGR